MGGGQAPLGARHCRPGVFNAWEIGLGQFHGTFWKAAAQNRDQWRSGRKHVVLAWIIDRLLALLPLVQSVLGKPRK
eukprot:11158113-Lingulodinium_polyedra.AAC.1